MTNGSGPISANQLHLMTRILTNAGQDRSFRTRDLVRLSRTSPPELQTAAQKLQDLIIREVKAGNLDFIAVAKQGADLIEAAEAEISTLQTELAKRPTIKDLEDRQREIGTLRLADDVLRGRITRRERTIEVLQQREVGYLERIERLEAEVTRLSPLEEKTRSLEAENRRLSDELKDFAQTDKVQKLQSNAEAEATLAQRTRERDSERETAKDLQTRLTSTSQRLSQLQSFEQVATVMTNENGELRKALDGNEAVYARMERAKQKEIDELQREQNIRDERIDELKREVERLKPEVESLRGLLAAGKEFFGRSETTDGKGARLTLTSGELLSSGVKKPPK